MELGTGLLDGGERRGRKRDRERKRERRDRKGRRAVIININVHTLIGIL